MRDTVYYFIAEFEGTLAPRIALFQRILFVLLSYVPAVGPHGFGLVFAAAEARSRNSTELYSSVQPTDLKTEHLTNPLGVQTTQPRFRWRLDSHGRAKLQSAYQILVATTQANLQAGIGDKWDSGKIVSDNSIEVLYAGSELASAERVYWKVRVWDEKGLLSNYSPEAFFEMGLRKPLDWKGIWIAAPQGISSPLFRREFSIDAPVHRARVYVSGLGYYELSINGVKVGDRMLDPAPSYYNKGISSQLGSHVLYATYDVTDALRVGKNSVGIMLGHGWYSAETDAIFRTPYGDRPKTIFQLNLELSNGRTLTFVSDENWRTSPGPITYNDLAQGESYDARLEQPAWATPGFDDTNWQRAVPVDAPSGVLTGELLPPERLMATLPVAKVIIPREPAFFDNTYVYDFGQQFTGWVRLLVSGPRGATITLKYGSRLYSDDDTLDTRSNEVPLYASARQRDTYILKGQDTEIWEPRFTLHGFRYVEVRGFTDTPSLRGIEGRFIHSALEPAGSFVSSNELLNRIHHNIQWTFMSSLHGLFQDAADRAERVAWIGDPGFVAEDYIYNYDMVGYLEKWLNDIQDTQKEDGLIPMTTPDHMEGADGEANYAIWPSWQSTYHLLVWYLYQYYGDRHVLERHFGSLKKLTDSLSAATDKHLFSHEPYGDHMEPQPQGFSRLASRNTPTALTATAYYYYQVSLLAKMADALGRSQDAQTYGRLAKDIKEAFDRTFYNSTTHQYATGSQTSSALPLALGLVPRERIPTVMKDLVDNITNEHATHVSTGIIGTNALVQALPEYGAAELMYKLSTQTTYPSLGYQVAMGATAVCETYECSPSSSQNMKMFGSWDKFFYRNLAGIQPTSPGYRRVSIKPLPLGDLHSVTASVRTVRGDIAVDWNRGSNAFELSVSIPAGMDADIALPRLGLHNPTISEGTATVWKSGTYIPGVFGLASAKANADAIVFRAGSGTYHFVLSSTDND